MGNLAHPGFQELDREALAATSGGDWASVIAAIKLVIGTNPSGPGDPGDPGYPEPTTPTGPGTTQVG